MNPNLLTIPVFLLFLCLNNTYARNLKMEHSNGLLFCNPLREVCVTLVASGEHHANLVSVKEKDLKVTYFSDPICSLPMTG